MRNPGRLVVFSMLFIVVYTLCFYFSVALFKYYPMVREFHVNSQGRAAGPPISWYGWIAVATLVSGAVALIVPGRLADRIPPVVSWAVPLAVLVTVLIYEKRWFV
jgi:MFS family permease